LFCFVSFKQYFLDFARNRLGDGMPLAELALAADVTSHPEGPDGELGLGHAEFNL
jgi:hypothetical protein